MGHFLCQRSQILGETGSLGEVTPLLSVAKAVSPCAETPPVPAAFLAWEPQPGTTNPGPYLGGSRSTWLPRSEYTQRDP